MLMYIDGQYNYFLKAQCLESYYPLVVYLYQNYMSLQELKQLIDTCIKNILLKVEFYTMINRGIGSWKYKEIRMILPNFSWV